MFFEKNQQEFSVLLNNSCARLIVTFHKLLTLDNKNKTYFILYCARLIVTLHRF